MIITEIKEYDKKRRKLILDEGELVFLLYTGELRRLGLKEGDELSDREYRDIEETVLIPRAKKRVLFYLKNGEKTRAEVRRKLKEGFYPESVIEAAIAFLESYSFVDDKRYADSFVESRRGKYSRRELEAKLYQKGISGENIREALGQLEAEDEAEACIGLLKKRIKNAEQLSDPSERRRHFAYLARKGYSFDAIENAMRAVESSIY